MTKTIFWNVDTQKDFMEPDGALAILGAMAIARNLGYLTLLADWKQIKVVNTGDLHTFDSREIVQFPDFKTTFPYHCMEGTPGYMFIRETDPVQPYVIHWCNTRFDQRKVKTHRNIVLYKDEFDCFHPTGAPHTEKILEILKPERAIVYGVATNVCVDYAVRGLLERGVEVVVPFDAIKELPGLPLEEVLSKWKTAGATFTTTKDIPQYLE